MCGEDTAPLMKDAVLKGQAEEFGRCLAGC